MTSVSRVGGVTQKADNCIDKLRELDNGKGWGGGVKKSDIFAP